MADTVLFDLDGTLVEYERSGQEVLSMAFDRVGVDPFFEAADYEARYETFFPESDSIAHLRELIFADIAESRGLDPDIGVQVAQVYDDERDYGRVELLPGALDLLDALADRTLGMVTNGDPEMQRPKLRATGIESYFETVVYAGHDAPAKPDPEPFHLALDRLGQRPETSIYVGNDPEADVGGARAAGMDSVWLRNGSTATPQTEPTYTIEALGDLFETTLFADSR